MIAIYYYPGSCAFASHLALEETDVPYEAVKVDLYQGEQDKPEYRSINPRGKVPALVVDGQVIVENVAILFYIARSFPAAQLLPSDAIAEARCLSLLAWFSNHAHLYFREMSRPNRYVADDAVFPAIQAFGRDASWAICQEIDILLAGKDWLLGDQFTVADIYAFVFYGWGTHWAFAMEDLPNFTGFKDRMLGRPAVRRVMEHHRGDWAGSWCGLLLQAA